MNITLKGHSEPYPLSLMSSEQSRVTWNPLSHSVKSHLPLYILIVGRGCPLHVGEAQEDHAGGF